jgi:hypothetical protein
MSRLKTVIGVIAIVISTGCTQMIRVQDAQRLIPTRVPTSHPIGLNPPKFALLPGTVVGGHAINPTRNYHLEHKWGETFEVDPNEFNFALRDELKSHGYTFSVGGRARYQLRATVTRVVYNLFGSSPRSGWSESEIEVRWEFDGPNGLVFTTRGSANTRQHSLASLFTAFRVALRNLLANHRVVALVAPGGLTQPTVAQPTPTVPPRPPVAPPSGGQWQVPLPSGSNALLPAQSLVQAARQGTVTVLVGDSWGSGTIVSTNGLVVTSAHLVSGGRPVRAVTHDGVEREAVVLLIQTQHNVALLRVSGPGLTPLVFRSAGAILGEYVTAIGTPFHPALSHSVSRGRIVSNEGDRLGIDARVSPGNSGGPAVDGYARTVGILTWPVGLNTPTARGRLVPAAVVFRALNISYRRTP